jgi:peroxisomal membrane protein 4
LVSNRFLLTTCYFPVDGPFSEGTHSLSATMAEAGKPERPYHALIAGAVGSYFVWGRYSNVNHQVNLYITSRVLVGFSKRLWERYHGTPAHGSVLHHPKTYPLLAATVWGLVMVLFEDSPHVLQRSLKKSMDEIYRFQLSDLSSTSE